jgi:hypothetical protein
MLPGMSAIGANGELQARRPACRICGRPDKFDFRVDDATWELVVPAGYREVVVCLTCFDTLALASGQTYALAGPLYFVGDQGVFVFDPREGQ